MLNLINTIPLPTFVATADDVIVHANELGLKFFNTNLDSLKNQLIAVVFSDISKDHIQAAQLSENGVLYHIYYIMGNTKVSELEELVYSVSHDLQEPLNAISGYSNLLKEESYFDKVHDPLKGSYIIDNLTELISSKAWAYFLELDTFKSLNATDKILKIKSDITIKRTQRLNLFNQKQIKLIGINLFNTANPNPQEWKKEIKYLEIPYLIYEEIEDIK